MQPEAKHKKKKGVEFTQGDRPHSSLSITTVTDVGSFKFLGNISCITKETQRRLFFPRQLKTLNLPQSVLNQFYTVHCQVHPHIIHHCLVQTFRGCSSSFIQPRRSSAVNSPSLIICALEAGGGTSTHHPGQPLLIFFLRVKKKRSHPNLHQQTLMLFPN